MRNDDTIPIGLCQCGCGGHPTIAKETRADTGEVKGQPRQFLRGHYARWKSHQRAMSADPNPSGFCQCGCGAETSIVLHAQPEHGLFYGHHHRFIHGHAVIVRWREIERADPPNPSGLCMCGCGQPTKRARGSRTEMGDVSGEHLRFIQGHKPPFRITGNAETRQCTDCKRILPIERFNRSVGDKLGRRYMCKACDTDRSRWKSRKTTYGITKAQFEQMLADQGGVCAICGGDFSDQERSRCVDHDHATGAIRGILCRRCNHMLGCAKDDRKILRKAIEYLG